ncbi:UDP-4-amino-4-deoxy-L-arabinose--oxoglutarate aminotransferase ArnB [Variovorax paradoxus B4]|uniref:UDP-4-amino-4-deoxy-L-arabinose--oxoglutarate aminotransferase ArnB n=1 Tax=Variovorax paradoxus B4 TaxID=1246301 RepID=T1XIQ9_VARPD|nr:DegT/DnrJ/EryC1/StrS aminotransferase family protein [Variovorax paradoxus]AGU52431.1 UDP-4-amino-4-deoxy-L-arabinose--oxoglutarate aminotransferase ArnB [Variovorax paradoxus B4]
MPPELPFLPFALPDTGEEEIAEVSEAIRSGWITTGPKAKRFERDFGMFLGDTQLHCMAVNSATAGLHLALEALGVGPGDEVITTTHTFTATAEVVRYLGADVVLVDVDWRTLCIDVRQLEAAITTRTKAVIPVHYAGLSADMTTLMAIACKHGLKVVEDAAHALPTTSDGRLVGTLDSDITVFSFYANKTISTGEGGMVVTRDTSLAERIKVMRLHGINRDAFDRFRSTKPAWYYEVIAPGFKYNMTDIAAGMGIAQLAKLPRFVARRQYLAERYGERLASLPLLLPALPPPGEIHAWHLYVIRLTEDATISRDALIQALSDKGIGTSVHYIPLHRQPYWRDRYGLNAQMFPHSEAAYQRMLSIPLFTAMDDSDQDRVIAALYELLS